jgi:hypothetical protein
LSHLEQLFSEAGRPIPEGLATWEDRLDDWCADYRGAGDSAEIVEIKLGSFVFLFDLVDERVVIAYGMSNPEKRRRDASRMKGFPNVNAGVRAVLGDQAFPADKGHFLNHASGGQLDMNLFPQKRDLNRGWSEEGKRYRRMERYVAEHEGAFFYHRPIYVDDTWIPGELDYGVLMDDRQWWVDKFHNR